MYHCPTEDELEVLRDHVAHGHIGDQVAAAVNPVFSHFAGFSLVRKDGWIEEKSGVDWRAGKEVTKRGDL